MNEAFLIRLTRHRRTWPVRGLSADRGVLLDEPDAAWRPLRLEFDARNAATAARLDRIRSLHGWPPWQFHLDASLAEGRVLFTGVDAYALPPGHYFCRLRIRDLVISGARVNFEIEEHGRAELPLPVKPDPRRVAVSLDAIDPEIARVLDEADAVDGLTLRDWLEEDGPSPVRKACLINVLAALRTNPSASDPFIRQVRRVFAVERDRIYAAVDCALYERFATLAGNPDRRVYAEGPPHAPIHQQLVDAIPDPAHDPRPDLWSFRSEGRPSLQAVIAVPHAGYPPRCYADFDLDLGNPLQDVEGFAIHMGELSASGPTDHLKLWSKLKHTRAGRYLYYRVIAA